MLHWYRWNRFHVPVHRNWNKNTFGFMLTLNLNIFTCMCVCVCVFILFLRPRLPMQNRLVFNLWCFCLSFPNIGITEVYHRALYIYHIPLKNSTMLSYYSYVINVHLNYSYTFSFSLLTFVSCISKGPADILLPEENP
jgi:hypothetical protein